MMEIPRKKRPRFKFRLAPTLLALVLLPVFVGLGFWQLDRAKQKLALQRAYDTRTQAPPLVLTGALQSAEQLRYRRLSVHGVYETEHQILIDNRVNRGRVGYHVITPLRISGSNTRVLVNRGWVPLGRSRDFLPVIDTPKVEQLIRGVATIPLLNRFSLREPAPVAKEAWPRRWLQMNLKRFRDAVDYPVQPFLILLDKNSPAGGFERNWRKLDKSITVHRGYAFQWYALAVTVLFGYVLLGIRAARRGAGDDESNTQSEV